MITEDTAYLQISASQVDLQGVLLGSIIIGSLGVLNDVTVTQASAVWALRCGEPGVDRCGPLPGGDAHRP